MNKSLDYIIVGQGVAGSCFAMKLLQEDKSFIVIDQDEYQASKVAVGVFNAVVLKRFALIWYAEEQLELMNQYFSSFEDLLNQTFISKIPTYRILNNEKEIETWKTKSKRPDLKAFMEEEIIPTSPSDSIKAPLGYAEVKQSGRIDLDNCLSSFQTYLQNKNWLLNEKFEFDSFEINQDYVQYKDFKAKQIVFCEGYGIKQNPLFNYLPIIGVKGEVLKIKTEKKIPNGIWKGRNFLMPLADNICFTASTYDRDDLTPEPTEKGKQDMLKYLEEIYTGAYEVIEHTAGIRPTVIDRRPIIGSHPKHKNVFLLNGMGTRGTLLAPHMTEFLYHSIENNQPIDKEADIRRFDHLQE